MDFTSDIIDEGPFLEPSLIELEWTATAVVKCAGVAPADLASAFDRGFHAVGEALQEEGRVPSGPAFALYAEPPGETFDLEIGFPVGRPLQGGEPSYEINGDLDVVPSRLPEGRMAVLSHLGPYDQLGASWQKLVDWAAANGHQPAGAFWEAYVTEPRPDSDPATLRTDLFLPLR